MKVRNRLSRRIVVAFVLMAAVISALFSVGVIIVVSVIEKQLVSDTLHSDLTLAMSNFSTGRSLDLQPGSNFYYDNSQADSDKAGDPDETPEWLEQLGSGLHQVSRENRMYHAIVYRQGDEKFLLIKDQTDLQKRERALFLIVIAGFVLSVAAAWILGHLLSRRIMAPVARLASQVEDRDQLLLLAPQLAPEYADDEVGQLAAAFDSALDQLRAALERERFFTSDVSHELRTPLTVIITSCELLQAADSLSSKQRDQLLRIRRACEEMRDLVRMFLLLARNNLTQEEHFERATLSQIAQEQVQHWSVQAENKGLTLEWVQDCAGEGDAVFNVPLLRAVLSNLLRNAVHYTDTGFVRLVVEGNGFRVEDSGKGIANAQQEEIFKPFVRGEGARGEGLGLGLSLVKRICAHQGWQIELRSLEPHGSCFRVTLV